MITDEQARAAAERIRDDGDDTFASTACYWESSQRDDDMRCLSEYVLQELAKREAEHQLTKPIAPAWLKSVGFVEHGLRFEMPVDSRMLLFYPASNAVWLDGHRQGVYESREELLALLAELRGDLANA